MIELSMEDFILWMIGAPLVAIGLVSLLAGMRRRSRKRTLHKQIVRCRICGHMYKDQTRERIVECPECGRPNEKGGSRRLG